MVLLAVEVWCYCQWQCRCGVTVSGSVGVSERPPVKDNV